MSNPVTFIAIAFIKFPSKNPTDKIVYEFSVAINLHNMDLSKLRFLVSTILPTTN